MYKSFFGMNETPFVRNVPAEMLFESRSMREILDRLHYVAKQQQFAVMTSDAGCGKSTLIRKFSEELPKDQYILLYLSDSKLTPRWFYKGLLDQLGFESKFYRGDSKRILQQEIEIIRGIHHKKVVCDLDEAHLLEKETLEEFRFLLNYKFDSMSPLALILVGQTELWDQKLRLQKYAAIRQIFDMYCVLPHFDRSESEQYIRCHLAYAGYEGELFTDKAIDEIHRVSSGIPRLINHICDKSLLYCFQQHKKLVDNYSVNYVCEHEMLSCN